MGHAYGMAQKATTFDSTDLGTALESWIQIVKEATTLDPVMEPVPEFCRMLIEEERIIRKLSSISHEKCSSHAWNPGV